MRDDGGDMGEMTGEMTGGIKTLSRAKPPMYKGVSRNDGRDEGFSSLIIEELSYFRRAVISRPTRT